MRQRSAASRGDGLPIEPGGGMKDDLAPRNHRSAAPQVVRESKWRIQVNGRNRKDIDEQMRWGSTPAAGAAQRTLTVIDELPAAPLLSVTVSLTLKLPVPG